MKKTILISLIILFGVAVFAVEAQEAVPTVLDSQDVLNSLINLIRESSKKWVQVLKDYALGLFVILVGLNLIVRAMLMLLEGNLDTAKVAGFLARYFLVAIIFYFILDQGVELAEDIINSFIRLGTEASNLTGSPASVDRLLSIAFNMMNTTLDTISLTNVAQPIISFILSFATYIVLLLIVANYIVEICATWILVYAGYFVLAFGGSEWTREIAISYIKAIISSGLRLLSIMFMMGIAINMLDRYSDNLGASFGATLLAFAIAVILLILVNKIPDAIGNLASSAWGHMSGFNMASGMAASMTAIKMATGGVKLATGGAKSFKAGATDFMANKAAGAAGGDNKLKSGSGLSYMAGKGTAFLADKLLSKNGGSSNGGSSGSFGQSDLMSNSSNSSNNTNSNNSNNSGNTGSTSSASTPDSSDKQDNSNQNNNTNQKEKD